MLKDDYADVIDIIFALTRPRWEKELLVVRVPLLKGYMGYRVNFIDQKNLKKFAKIDTIEQLNAMKLGSGTDWSTTKIHQQNGFTTLVAPNTPALIPLLFKNRIDYFSRGITEIMREYQKFKPLYPALTIEPTILVQMPVPVYFFVNPHKPELAKRIHQGILNLIKNGTYEKIFNKHMGDFEKQLNIKK